MFAARNNNKEEVVLELLRAGANVNEKNKVSEMFFWCQHVITSYYYFVVCCLLFSMVILLYTWLLSTMHRLV